MSNTLQRTIQVLEENNEFELIESYKEEKNCKIVIKCKKCGYIFERWAHHFNEYPHVCPKCSPKGSRQKITLEEAQFRVDQQYGIGVLKMLDYTGNNTKSHVQCLRCGQIFERVPTTIWRGRAKACPYCDKTISLGESHVEKWLREHKIQFNRQYSFPDLVNVLPLHFDFFLPQHNICIEFQGEQHYNSHSMFFSTLGCERDQMKRDYCYKNNITLIEIPYTDIDCIDTHLNFLIKD